MPRFKPENLPYKPEKGPTNRSSDRSPTAGKDRLLGAVRPMCQVGKHSFVSGLSSLWVVSEAPARASGPRTLAQRNAAKRPSRIELPTSLALGNPRHSRFRGPPGTASSSRLSSKVQVSIEVAEGGQVRTCLGRQGVMLALSPSPSPSHSLALTLGTSDVMHSSRSEQNETSSVLMSCAPWGGLMSCSPSLSPHTLAPTVHRGLHI